MFHVLNSADVYLHVYQGSLTQLLDISRHNKIHTQKCKGCDVTPCRRQNIFYVHLPLSQCKQINNAESVN